MDKIIIGIDPGKNGGLSWYQSENNSVHVIKMPPTIKDLWEFFDGFREDVNSGNRAVHCYIEDVGKGIPGQSSKATATFARGVGNLEMALTASKIPFTFVTPAKWMKALSLGNSKDYPTHVAWKNHLKERAQQEFPEIKITLWNADALLIMLYGKLKEK